MLLASRINNMIEEAYFKGETSINTPLYSFEVPEMEGCIEDLRSRDIRAHYDDRYNEFWVHLPHISLAERASRISYNVDSVILKTINTITEEILELAQHGCIEMEEDFYDISDPAIIDQVHAYFSREGFNVKRTDNPERNHSSLRIRWSK